MQIYNSIDTLPIWNYWQCINKNSREPLIIDCPKSTPEPTKQKALSEAWNKIENEMIALQLQDPKYVLQLKDDARHILRQIKAMLSGKTIDKLHYEMSVLKRDSVLQKDFNYNKSVAILEKYLSRAIDDKIMTVTRYYTHWQMMIEHGRKAN